MSLLICRVCLNENLKMHNIADDKLRQIFAKLASCELNSDDGMPTTVCYICVSQLRRCRRFFDMVNESTRALTHLLHNSIEISTNNLTGLTRSTTQQLTMKTLPQISLLDSDLDSSIAEVIQEEVVVKGEPTENDDLMDTEESKRVNINANNPLANVEPEQDVKNETANDFFIEIEVDRLVDSDSGPKKPKDSEISLYCDVCDNLCTSKTELITHLRIHSEEKRYACERCRKSFDQAGALEHHMLIHIGEKTYPCNICNKTFTRTDHLKRHMLIHTGKKPFICEVCEKAFVQAGDLKRHLRVHTGEKPYSCKYCCKTFRFAGHSRLHMRTHTGEKPFVCMYCDKKFNVSGNLKHHIQTQHSDKHNPVLIFDQPNQP